MRGVKGPHARALHRGASMSLSHYTPLRILATAIILTACAHAAINVRDKGATGNGETIDTATFVEVTGPQSSGATLSTNDLRHAKESIRSTGGAHRNAVQLK